MLRDVLMVTIKHKTQFDRLVCLFLLASSISSSEKYMHGLKFDIVYMELTIFHISTIDTHRHKNNPICETVTLNFNHVLGYKDVNFELC